MYPERPTLSHKSMLSTFFANENWIAEKKYNGSRLQLHLGQEHIEFWNRHGDLFNYEPDKVLKSELVLLQSLVKQPLIFDGELRHNKVRGIKHKIVIYDVFLIGSAFEARREFLETLFRVNAEPIGISEQYLTNFESIFERVIQEEEIEGLVLKRKDGKLNISANKAQDSLWMYKIRKPNANYLS